MSLDKKVNIYFGGTNPHDEDLECVCDRCDVKITEEEKAVDLMNLFLSFCDDSEVEKYSTKPQIILKAILPTYLK